MSYDVLLSVAGGPHWEVGREMYWDATGSEAIWSPEPYWLRLIFQLFSQI